MLSSGTSFYSLLPGAAGLTLVPELSGDLQDFDLFSSVAFSLTYLGFLLQALKGIITFLELVKTPVPLHLEKAELNNLSFDWKYVPGNLDL